MASAIIHLAVAKTLEKNFNIENKRDYYLGSIAPDISKQIGETRIKSHFLVKPLNEIPQINLFTKKYPNFINNSFDLGYFIHLYTDKIWFSEFINKIQEGNYIKLLDGTVINSTQEEITKIIYQDYTNLNIQLLDKYQMDLSLFYEDFIIPNTTLDEIPTEKLNVLLEQMGIIIKNTKVEKPYTFDIFSITQFIEEVSQKILDILNIKKDY